MYTFVGAPCEVPFDALCDNMRFLEYEEPKESRGEQPHSTPQTRSPQGDTGNRVPMFSRGKLRFKGY